MTRLRQFPLAKRFIGGTLLDEANAIESETAEMLREAYSLGTFAEDIEALTEETWDVIHAAETMLHMLEEQGVDVQAIRARVERKNLDRGYYHEI